jgi:hypothetical protein
MLESANKSLNKAEEVLNLDFTYRKLNGVFPKY